MKRAEIISAVHEGLSTAVIDFHRWSCGESMRDFGVESMLTTECARTLYGRMPIGGRQQPITLEQDFRSILEFSDRINPVGRPIREISALGAKPAGRVDLVLWNRSGTPRVIIEIKRQPHKGGLLEDANRVMSFVRAAGNAYRGSVRYGIVGSLFYRSNSRTEAHLLAMVLDRTKMMESAAARWKMSVERFGPNWIDHCDGTEPRTCSVVWRFQE